MQHKDDDLDGLAVFVEVVRRNGFSAAAERLGRSASHMSKEVTRLEERLGVRLLQRTTRSVALTEDGRDFYASAESIVDLARDATEQIAGHGETPKGRLRVAAPMSLALSSLNALLPKFLETYPDITLDIDLNDRRVDVVAEGFDMALRVGDLPDSSLIAKKLAEYRGVVVATPQYWDRHGRPGHPSDLAGHTAACYSNLRHPDRWSFPGPDGNAIDVTVPVRVLSNSAETELQVVLQGLAMSRLPDFVCRPAIDDGRLEVVLEDFERDPIPLWALYPHRAQKPAKLNAFIEFLQANLQR